MSEIKVKAEPWKRQRILKKEDIPTQQSVYNMAFKFDSLTEQALFVLAYLTGGRISEIVKCNFLRKNTYKKVKAKDRHGIKTYKIARNENESPIIIKVDKVPLNYKGIKKSDITFTNKKGKEIMIISMQNRKNKDFTRKNIPIPVHKEAHFVEIVQSFMQDKGIAEPLFNFGRSKAEQILSKVHMNPHFLRDIRLTHLVTIYDFNSFQLSKFAGWKDPRPAERYVRLGISDLIDKY